MKRYVTLIFMFAAVLSLTAQDVILTQDAHSFMVDEDNNMKMAAYVDPGQGGENRLWDLSKMSFQKKITGTVSASFSEDNNNNFPETNIVLNEFGNRFFFRLEENTLYNYGMMSKTGNYWMKYDKPFVKMKYPFRYGDVVSGDYSGSIKYTGSESSVTGTYEVVADGYGRLILPNGVTLQNTLRVKSKRSSKIEGTSSRENEIITYRWYAQNERYPVAVIQEIKTIYSGGNHVTRRAAYKDSDMISNIERETAGKSSSGITLYPNPVANGILTVSYSVKVDALVLIELYDNNGKKISDLLEKKQSSGSYSLELNIDEYSLPHGTYHLRTVIGGKTEVHPFIRL